MSGQDLLLAAAFAVAAFLEPSVVRVRPHLHQPAEEERKTFRQLGALREIGDPAATQRGRRAGDEDFAGLRRDESGEDAEERGFAGAVDTDETVPLTAGQFKFGVFEKFNSVESD